MPIHAHTWKRIDAHAINAYSLRPLPSPSFHLGTEAPSLFEVGAMKAQDWEGGRRRLEKRRESERGARREGR